MGLTVVGTGVPVRKDGKSRVDRTVEESLPEGSCEGI